MPATETYWLLLADIDRFKAINDRHGHLTGDAYLEAIAKVLGTFLPAPHYPARVGGEEFAAVLRDLAMEQARTLAEGMRLAVEELQEPARATVSIGIAAWLPASEPARKPSDEPT